MKKIIIITFTTVILILGSAYLWLYKTGNSELVLDVKTLERLKEKAKEAKAYCEANKMNTEFCFLVDFSIHSGKNRLFVWNFKTDSVLISSLCCHGQGGNSTTSTPEFKNIENSLCSSLGKYKIGVRAPSKWGIRVHYKMHGLETTNDEAYKRFIVLHSYQYVPEKPTYPIHLPLGMSSGCPVISNKTMTQIDEIMQKTETPPLLWIFI